MQFKTAWNEDHTNMKYQNSSMGRLGNVKAPNRIEAVWHNHKEGPIHV